VYRRYAGLFFCVCVDANDNELAYLEAIHLFVEILGTFELSKLGRGWGQRCTHKIDSFFDNVCELDLVFNFYKVCGSSLALRITANLLRLSGLCHSG
jgi:AP-2 complex subunit sigma-1